MNGDLHKLAAACTAAADHYCAKPDTAGPETLVDIYRILAVLAANIATQNYPRPSERVH